MGLAKYFDKAALAASQILQGYNREDFEKRLMATPIQVAFDQSATFSAEGVAILDLSIRLLARLYPKMKIVALDSNSQKLCDELKQLAKAINSEIEFTELKPFASIVIGNTKIEETENCFYIGSDEWNVCLSRSENVAIGNSLNPFGAGAAACFGAANVFRTVFHDQLINGEGDGDFAFSLLNFEHGRQTPEIPFNELDVSFEETFLVGFGAIGNGVLWALSRINKMQGSVYVVDDEKIELSNLQRYVLTLEDDQGKEKVRLCEHLNQESVFKPFFGKWAGFLNNRKNWNLPLVMLAVDSAEDRIAVQGSLPKYILNAWTQAEDLGISRHFDFCKDAGVCCLYPPRSGGQNKSELIAGALGLLHRENEIRTLVYNNAPLDEGWIKSVADAKGVPFKMLQPFIGLPINQFYSKVLCGGLLITDSKNKQTETPMAFQSALAGILLAAELVIHCSKIRTDKMPPITRINLLRPIGKYLNEPLMKSLNNTCICNDNDFKQQYNVKYAFN